MAPVRSPSGTISHSWEVFVAVLREAGIDTLVDVRRFPGSRRHPQFSGAAMGRRWPLTDGIA